MRQTNSQEAQAHLFRARWSTLLSFRVRAVTFIMMSLNNLSSYSLVFGLLGVFLNAFSVFLLLKPSQLLIFLRRWYPSKLQLSSLQEIAVERDNSVQGLKAKISEVSGIPVEFVEFTKSTAGFPSDVSVLSVQDMEWNRQADTIDGWPLSIDDGNVLFYRDNREQVKTLTNEERKELTNKENARLGSTCHFSSPRKERPLKIYFDGSRSNHTNSSTSSNADCSV